MKLPAFKPSPVKSGIFSELTEGLSYLKHTPAISMIILILSLVSFLVLPYETLLPVFAKEIFNGNAATFGYIRSFIGVGAIGGAFFLASLKPGADLKIVLLTNTIILGFGLIVFSHVVFFPIAMLFATLIGFGAMSQTTICLTIVQAKTDANMRGRVMSYLIMGMAGMMPLGSLLIGTISQHMGVSNTILCQGIIALIIVATFANFLRRDKLNRKDLNNLEETEEVIIK
jgi:predicted MFS family arabinose efflux permease